MKRVISLVLAVFILLGMVVSAAMPAFATTEGPAVAGPEGTQNGEMPAGEYDWEALKDEGIVLNVYNWGEYISDGSEGSLDVNAEFEALTGIEVQYTTFATNEEMYTKIKSGGASYDILIPSDYMIGRMIEEDMLMPLDFSLIPNMQYMNPTFLNGAFDPENEYYVPYTWGLVGIIYNTTMVSEPVTSWDVLWDENYAGNILMFNNSRDAAAIALLRAGKSLNPETSEDIQVAKEALIEQKPVVQAYVMDEIFDKMGGGEAAFAPYYSGDAVTMIDDNPDLAFAIPEEGTNYFVDGMVIPADSQNAQAAHMYINFLCETDIALANAEYIGYASPHTAAVELLDEETRSLEFLYPSEEVLANTEAFSVLSEELSAELDNAWSEVKAHSEESQNSFMPTILVGAFIALVIVILLRSKKKKKMDY